MIDGMQMLYGMYRLGSGCLKLVLGIRFVSFRIGYDFYVDAMSAYMKFSMSRDEYYDFISLSPDACLEMYKKHLAGLFSNGNAVLVMDYAVIPDGIHHKHFSYLPRYNAPADWTKHPDGSFIGMGGGYWKFPCWLDVGVGRPTFTNDFFSGMNIAHGER